MLCAYLLAVDAEVNLLNAQDLFKDADRLNVFALLTFVFRSVTSDWNWRAESSSLRNSAKNCC